MSILYKAEMYLFLLIIVATILNGCTKDKTTSKTDPVITWADPPDIGFGTLLSALQLNATADVHGTFINHGTDGFWWTNSAYNPDYSWYHYLHFDVAKVYRANFHKQYGFSLRCVRD